MEPITGIAIAMEIRQICIIICTPIFTGGIILLIYRNAFQTPGRMITSYVIVFIVAAMIATYPTAVIKLADAVTESTTMTTLKVEKALNAWQQAKIDGETSTFNFAAKFTKVVYAMCFSIASLVRDFLSYMQRMGLYILIALSPVMLSLILIKETSSIAVNFLMMSMALIMWSIGYNISDMIIVSGWNAMMHSSIAAAANLSADPDIQTAILGGTGLVFAPSFLIFLPTLSLLLAIKVALFFVLAIIIFNIMGVVVIITLLYGGSPVQAATGVISSVTSYSRAVLGNSPDKIAEKLGGGGGVKNIRVFINES